VSATALAPRFMIAVVVILVFCRFVSWAIGRAGQPPVVGEMIAGVLLGPSLLGLVAPSREDGLFPTALKPLIYVAGQIGLAARMLQAGHEFKSHLHKGVGRTAAAVSAAGATAPLALGVALTFAVHGHTDVFVPGVPVGVTAAFVGVALAITAFPMLARIITERGLTETRYGALALASGALDDVVAWCLLAGVLSVASGRNGPILHALGGAIVFGLLIIFAARRLLAAAMRHPTLTDESRLLAVAGVLFAASWFTDEIGLYTVFGAFCVGMAVPSGPVADRTVHAVSFNLRILFLPMFFTYSGLNTHFDLLGNRSLLLFSLAAVAAAVIGKFGACWFAAETRGEPRHTALSLGALMNARGLMQLIALNVGLTAGIVNAQLFSALVLVAIVTTLMTAPALSWIDRHVPKPVPDLLSGLLPDLLPVLADPAGEAGAAAGAAASESVGEAPEAAGAQSEPAMNDATVC
jgi:Kef-type K+ transport system membrane component KefB